MAAVIDLRHGDSLEVLPTLPDASVDAVVCDPPYGLAFMGKRWDYDVPSTALWREVLRVLKPGGHLLAFGGTRTYHRMVCAIEDAGFEIRDQIAWVYGSGFPKSLDVSKAIDKDEGIWRGRAGQAIAKDARRSMGQNYCRTPKGDPATDAARQWQGWGTALKPAIEPIVLARKPFPGTVAANVLERGTGALNIDGCRVAGEKPATTRGAGGLNGRYGPINAQGRIEDDGLGRWPANLIHDGSAEVVALFPDEAGAAAPVHRRNGDKFRTTYGAFKGDIDEAGSTFHGDTGSAARFFYCAKASKEDRDDGLDGFVAQHRPNGNKWTDQDYRVARGERPPSAESGPRRNHHPTVKPTDLMRYLCRLVTPPGGLVLDPFMGSGSTGRGAVLEGFRFIGIEREAEYLEIARARIQAAQRQPRLDLQTAAPACDLVAAAPAPSVAQGGLFE